MNRRTSEQTTDQPDFGFLDAASPAPDQPGLFPSAELLPGDSSTANSLTDAGRIDPAEPCASPLPSADVLIPSVPPDSFTPPANSNEPSVLTLPAAKPPHPDGDVMQNPEHPTSSTDPARTPADAATVSVARRDRSVLGYAIAVTLFVIYSWLTGRLSLTGHPALESLPDVRPLAPNEFRRVPDDAALPDGHVLRLGESRRFGDVVVTPVRVTREPLLFEGFQSGVPAAQLTTSAVLKLWLQFENVADDYGFPPFDAALMSHRTPPNGTDESTIANSFLTISRSGEAAVRVLNYLQTMDSNFVLTGQQSARVVMPGESLTTFLASDINVPHDTQLASASCRWRVQFRKGANRDRTAGVTTLIDVLFDASDVMTPSIQ